MAGGPLSPVSAIPVTSDRVFPHIYVGDGANSQHEEALGVEDSLGADATWRLRWKFPEDLPTGQCKLQLWALADAVTGHVVVDPQWASVTAEEDPSSAALSVESPYTLAWSAADDDVYKELKIDLDADTPVAGEMCVMDLIFKTTGTDLAVVSAWYPWLIWE